MQYRIRLDFINKAVQLSKNAQLLLAGTARTGENSWKLFLHGAMKTRTPQNLDIWQKLFLPFFLNEGTRNPVNSVGY
jgi:hypothetical protein